MYAIKDAVAQVWESTPTTNRNIDLL